MSTEQHLLTIQTALTVAPSRLTVQNREFLIAPAVLAVCGVMNGGLLVEEAIVPDDWNHVPVVISHPYSATGDPISARSPDVLAQRGVGYVYHARRGEGLRGAQPVASLQAELWLDVMRCQELGGEALQALQMLEAQQNLEVSTAFYPDAVQERGSFYGTPYTQIYYGLRPDHLALLPNGVGACSWTNGGCGAPRLHTQGACACQTEETAMETVSLSAWHRLLALLRLVPQPSGGDLLTVEQTDQDIRSSLYGALAREMGDDVHMTPYFIQDLDVQAQSFTYQMGERLQRRHWTMEGDVLTLDAAVEDVQRNTTYTPVPVTQEQEDPMEPTTNAAPVTTPPPATMEEAIATLPAHLQAPIASMAHEYAQRHATARAVVLADPRNPFTDLTLQAMTVQQVEALAQLITPPPLTVAASSYAGRGVPVTVAPEEHSTPAPDTFALIVERQKKMNLR